MKKEDIGILTSIGVNADFINKIEKACEKAANEISQRVRELGNTPTDKAQGYFAEVWHAETFNVDATLNRMDTVVSELPKSNASLSADILVKENGRTVQEISSKYYQNAGASVNEQKGYENQERLIPSDQIEEAEKYADQKIAKDLATGRESRIDNAEKVKEVKERLTDRVKHDDAESEPLGRKESESMYKRTKRGEELDIRPQIEFSNIVEESLRSGAIAAGITISTALAPQIYNILVKRCQEGIWPQNSLQSIFQGTGSKAAEAGMRGSIATAITMSAKAGYLGQATRDLDPTMIGTMTFIAFEGAKDFSSYTNGELTGELFADSMMRKSISATAGAYGATLGQVLIPVPVVGAMVGAILGSIMAQQGYQFMEIVTESYFRSKEFEEIKQVNIRLADEWNSFISAYDQWKERRILYEIDKQRWQTKLQKSETVDRQLDLKIKEALEDSYE